jgi:hyperosmotically inducible periplasmic protein
MLFGSQGDTCHLFRRAKMLRRLALIATMSGIIATIACGQSDPGITTEVKSKLAADDTVKAYQIDVDTKDRIVTLSGTVETAAARDQAVLIARQSDGVRDVVDRLAVSGDAAPTTGLREEANEAGRETREEAREAADAAKEAGRDAQTRADDAAERSGAAVTDAAVTSAVKTKFLADTAVSGLNIDVDTRDGVVTLTGTVATKAEADRATSLARESNGVKRVVSNLRIGR